MLNLCAYKSEHSILVALRYRIVRESGTWKDEGAEAAVVVGVGAGYAPVLRLMFLMVAEEKVPSSTHFHRHRHFLLMETAHLKRCKWHSQLLPISSRAARTSSK